MHGNCKLDATLQKICDYPLTPEAARAMVCTRWAGSDPTGGETRKDVVVTKSRTGPTIYPQLPRADRELLVHQLTAIVLARHPDLDDADRDEVISTVTAQVDDSQVLHGFALSNADEPIFVAYGGEHR